MSMSINSAYAGELHDSIKTKLSTGNDVLANGLANYIDKITHKTYIPLFAASNLIDARVEQPTASIGTSAYGEKAITVADFMIYHEFNPRSWEHTWRKYQPQGPLVFRELPTEIQILLMNEIARAASVKVAEILIAGDTTGPTAPLNIMNGLVAYLAHDGETQTASAPTTLTVGNYQAEIEKLYVATPLATRRDPGVKILMGPDTAEIHRNTVHNQTYKGNDFTQDAPMTYKGKPIVELVSMPANTMIMGKFTPNLDSHLHIALDWDSNSIALGEDVLLVDKVSNAGEKYFVKGLFQMGLGVSFSDEIGTYGSQF